MNKVAARNVGFVSTRLAGTDGVSLETAKWASIFEKEGFVCYYFAGEVDRALDRSMVVAEAHFRHPEILKLQEECFGRQTRAPETTDKIERIKRTLKQALYEFIRKFNICTLVPQNALAIPLNIPLGLALTEVIAETGINTIAHHHDFYWERQRFLNNAVWDYINMAFPPHLPTIQHVVISSSADNQLGLRTGISSTLMPNVMDFEHPPEAPDEYAQDARKSLGVADDELLILQPTRIVLRKGIRNAVELVHMLGRKAKLVISHRPGDEGYEYAERVKYYSELFGVQTVFASDIIDENRGWTREGRKIYTLNDVYPFADLVTYPSTFEGFGNAFLEAVYFRKPLVVNNYSIYSTDIKPKGFEVIEFDGFISKDTVRQTQRVLDDAAYRHEMVEKNYQLGLIYFSYTGLHRKLHNLIADCHSTNLQTPCGCLQNCKCVPDTPPTVNGRAYQ
ncbi:MAG: glycosyltransferase family 4 protein [Sedimentisphaerales bacterium]|nr:glycosyltransferase family 4 protein [Sedimentisphaerales bacterium]